MIKNKEKMIEFLLINSKTLLNIYSKMNVKSGLFQKSPLFFLEVDPDFNYGKNVFILSDIINKLPEISEEGYELLIIYNYCMLFLAKNKISKDFTLSKEEYKIIEEIIENMKYGFISQKEYETCFLRRMSNKYFSVDRSDLTLDEMKTVLLEDIEKIKKEHNEYCIKYFIPEFTINDENKEKLIFKMESEYEIMEENFNSEEEEEGFNNKSKLSTFIDLIKGVDEKVINNILTNNEEMSAKSFFEKIVELDEKEPNTLFSGLNNTIIMIREEISFCEENGSNEFYEFLHEGFIDLKVNLMRNKLLLNEPVNINVISNFENEDIYLEENKSFFQTNNLILYILKEVYCKIVDDENSAFLKKDFESNVKVNINNNNYRACKFIMKDRDIITLRKMSK